MKRNWNISGLILEGISGSGKTTIFRSLLRAERFVQRSFFSSIVLSEHQTQRVLEQKERETGLTRKDNIGLLNNHVSYIEGVQNHLSQTEWCRNHRTNMRVLYIFERFHFTHVYHYHHMDWKDVEDIDSRLVLLNCKLCLLTMDISKLRDRILNCRDAGWRDYLSRYGDTDEKILDYYAKQQAFILDLCKKSKLDSFIINTTEMSLEDTVDQVLNFWNAV